MMSVSTGYAVYRVSFPLEVGVEFTTELEFRPPPKRHSAVAISIYIYSVYIYILFISKRVWVTMGSSFQ